MLLDTVQLKPGVYTNYGILELHRDNGEENGSYLGVKVLCHGKAESSSLEVRSVPSHAM